MQQKPIFIKNANEIITLKGSSTGPLKSEAMNELHIVHDGSIWIENGRIKAIKTEQEIIDEYKDKLDDAIVLNAKGKVVMPGLVDPHTHVVYAGSREQEFNMRLKGSTYMEIMNAGGGIHATTSRTKEASEEQLMEVTVPRLNRFLKHGVTTIEAKSGYGLDWENERKQLIVAKKLNESHPLDIVSTFMGAHAIPEKFKANPDHFVEMIVKDMLPSVANEKLAEFNDVFCEKGVFTPEQSKVILQAGKILGLTPKIHADEIEPYGGAELAAEIGAISADHLLKASDRGIQSMAESNVIGVLLPGTAFFLMAEYANGRKMIDNGVAVALSTDCNPGSSPTCSMPFMMNLACLKMGMTPAEAISAATINAAHAINRGNEIGSLEEGKKADILIVDVPNYLQLFYHYGMNHTDTVIKNGEVVVKEGNLCLSN